jgi:hypothetical protein
MSCDDFGPHYPLSPRLSAAWSSPSRPARACPDSCWGEFAECRIARSIGPGELAEVVCGAGAAVGFASGVVFLRETGHADDPMLGPAAIRFLCPNKAKHGCRPKPIGVSARMQCLFS